MTGEEFKARLRLLRRTQTGFAAELGVALRTVHYWAHRGPPSEVSYLLDVLTSLELPFGPDAAASDRYISSAIFTDKVVKVIDRLSEESEKLGRGTEFEQAIIIWIKENS